MNQNKPFVCNKTGERFETINQYIDHLERQPVLLGEQPEVKQAPPLTRLFKMFGKKKVKTMAKEETQQTQDNVSRAEFQGELQGIKAGMHELTNMVSEIARSLPKQEAKQEFPIETQKDRPMQQRGRIVIIIQDGNVEVLQ